MPELRTMLLDDVPKPWRLTHSGLRRSAAGEIPCDAASVDTALGLLDRTLAILSVTPEPPLPESLLTYWDFTASWLAEAMPDLADIGERPVASLLEKRDLGVPVSAAA